MEKVIGFGGFFFRAHGPKAKARRYENHLDEDQTLPDYNQAYGAQEKA